MAANTAEPWERQEGESAQAFEAFAKYRDMGPARSTAKVARELGKSGSLMDRWSRSYAWVLRATSWDREQDRVFLAEQRQARRDLARRHARLAQAFLSKAVARLQTLSPSELSPSDLLRYFQVAADIERRAVGEEPAWLPDDPDTEALDVAELTDEERRARMDQLRRELERRITTEEDTP
ncbi:hypothetical protein GCM10010193_57570 [Kitasatospora atroaurantiaca]|uniref:Uncharacterized protein n=1 Tax=Kitasatospora atroaurantiaca TaxID=285545 RepID=A0A561EN45_9ACTN|nr:hypothetical protein [Kitasatospora atroaurantiaca]TWE17002.1 hypothetical protein FB465_1999 [Kitasatospora atroaurantiaca]